MPAMDQKVARRDQEARGRRQVRGPALHGAADPELTTQQHILRMPADQWPDPVNRAFKHLNPKVYVPMQGPSELGASGKLANWDRTADLKKITVPTLIDRRAVRHDGPEAHGVDVEADAEGALPVSAPTAATWRSTTTRRPTCAASRSSSRTWTAEPSSSDHCFAGRDQLKSSTASSRSRTPARVVRTTTSSAPASHSGVNAFPRNIRNSAHLLTPGAALARSASWEMPGAHTLPRVWRTEPPSA